MTREDAKRTLQDMWECLFNEMTNHTFEDLKEHGMLDNYSTAFDMAISALSENKRENIHGHWIEHKEHCENLGVTPSGLGAYKWCSKCDCGIDVGEWHRNNYNFCPNCGADMRGET